MALFKKLKAKRQEKKATRKANKQAKKDAKIAKINAKTAVKLAKAEGIKNGTYQPTTVGSVLKGIGSTAANIATSFIGGNTATPEEFQETETTTQPTNDKKFVLLGLVGVAIAGLLMFAFKK